jgi:tRNA threonylcarbamoyladenosine biosynthesis protein TsaB
MIGDGLEILGQIELEGRSYSSTLVAAVAELLAQNAVELRNVSAIVAVNGPGSFTGVRVGLSAVKGLAEPAQIPVVAVSRLEVLANIAVLATIAVLANIAEQTAENLVRTVGRDFSPGINRAKSERALAPEVCFPSSALDAHRGEVFLRLVAPGSAARELLAGAAELAAIPAPPQIAVCDDAAALVFASAWPATELLRTPAPTAADALKLCAPRVAAGQFIDLALLDGHYLRRPDAEIFGAEIFGAKTPTVPAGQNRP